MNTVDPIRDWGLLLDIQDYLQEKCERNYVLLMTGIHLGLRISDILNLKVKDVRGKDYIYIREEKTDKENKIIINEELKEVYSKYTKGKRDRMYLFKGLGNRPNKPITRQQVYNILNNTVEAVAKERGIKCQDNIGCHTLRKTFGYWIYQDTKDAVTIMELLNHSDVSVTKRYIGITQDSKDRVLKNRSYKRKRR